MGTEKRPIVDMMTMSTNRTNDKDRFSIVTINYSSGRAVFLVNLLQVALETIMFELVSVSEQDSEYVFETEIQ